MKYILPCLLGILVIILAVVVIINIVDTCQKLFPEPPSPPLPLPPPPNITNVTSYLPVRPAGIRSEQPTQTEQPGCAMQFDLLADGDTLTLTNCRVPLMVSGAQWFGQFGISDPRQASGNLEQATWDGQAVQIRGANQLIAIDASNDLTNWTQLTALTLPPGRYLTVTLPVACTNATFFRARVP